MTFRVIFTPKSLQSTIPRPPHLTVCPHSQAQDTTCHVIVLLRNFSVCHELTNARKKTNNNKNKTKKKNPTPTHHTKRDSRAEIQRSWTRLPHISRATHGHPVLQYPRAPRTNDSVYMMPSPTAYATPPRPLMYSRYVAAGTLPNVRASSSVNAPCSAD